jgi:hypothetical protein
MYLIIAACLVILFADGGGATVVLQDDFEYTADRSASNVETAFSPHGWNATKAINATSSSGAYGYLYTSTVSGWSSRALVIESLPATYSAVQTDHWIKFGSDSHSLGTVPANVWMQFWMYATSESRWDSQSKFIYPCHTSYPCPANAYLWLLMLSDRKIQPPGDNAVVAPDGYWHFELRGAHPNFSGGPSWNRQKLFQNLNGLQFAPGTWHQVRVHIDVSGAQGVYELWTREYGVAEWTKLAEWIGGVTADFDWPIPESLRSGMRQFAMPTTINAYDSIIYLDDFIMATSAEDLPDSSQIKARFHGSGVLRGPGRF